MTTLRTTTACIVGGGPAGAMLGLLLARSGIDVVVLEKHADFLRDFRGDTVHPTTLEVLEEIGLAEGFLKLPHRKVQTFAFIEGGKKRNMMDTRLLDLRFPYVAYVPQWDFLNFVTTEAARYPNFMLIMRATAEDVIRVGGTVAGVRYRDAEGCSHEIRAHLTVAADGRHSAVRAAAGLRPRDLGSSMDVVAFPLPREEGDPDYGFTLYSGKGHFVGVINRNTHWHIMNMVHKGGLEAIRREGEHALHDAVAGSVPFLGDRVRERVRLDEVNVLNVVVNRVHTWHKPGLLLIGDAAHAMSPLGGVGVNLAIQDAVATANLLTAQLGRWQEHGRPVPRGALARVQHRRILPTIATQLVQRLIQYGGIDRALRYPDSDTPSLFSRIPPNRTMARLMTRLIAVGVLPEHVRTPPAERAR